MYWFIIFPTSVVFELWCEVGGKFFLRLIFNFFFFTGLCAQISGARHIRSVFFSSLLNAWISISADASSGRRRTITLLLTLQSRRTSTISTTATPAWPLPPPPVGDCYVGSCKSANGWWNTKDKTPLRMDAAGKGNTPLPFFGGGGYSTETETPDCSDSDLKQNVRCAIWGPYLPLVLHPLCSQHLNPRSLSQATVSVRPASRPPPPSPSYRTFL